MILLNLLILTNIIVFIIDTSGFVYEMETLIHRYFFPKYPRESIKIPKPFSCSLCSTFWIGLIYLLFAHFTIPLLGYVALLAYLTPVFAELQATIKDLIMKIILKINNL